MAQSKEQSLVSQQSELNLPRKALYKAVLVDLIAAATASFMVSPIICVIDKAIVKNANGS